MALIRATSRFPFPHNVECSAAQMAHSRGIYVWRKSNETALLGRRPALVSAKFSTSSTYGPFVRSFGTANPLSVRRSPYRVLSTDTSLTPTGWSAIVRYATRGLTLELCFVLARGATRSSCNLRHNGLSKIPSFISLTRTENGPMVNSLVGNI